MDRRELLKRLTAVAAVPIVKFGTAGALQAEVKAGKQYLIFFDVNDLDATSIVGDIQPNCEAWFIGVHLKQGQTIDDVVKLYEVGEMKAGT